MQSANAVDHEQHPLRVHRGPPAAINGPGAPEKRSLFQRPRVIISLAAVVIVGLIFGSFAVLHSFTHETTDDAFVDAHIISMAPKVAGRVAAVRVNDNQFVKAGDVLVEIDPRDLDASLAQKRAARDVAAAKEKSAETTVEQQEAHLKTLQAVADSTAATAESARANAVKLRSDFQHNDQLFNQGVIAKETFQDSEHDADAAEKTFNADQRQNQAANAYRNEAEKQLANDRVQVQQEKADVAQAEADLQAAELQRSYATIRAPEDGRVTNRAVSAGDYVQVGQALMAIVPTHLFVTANFKETQLTNMRPGQPATISVDAYPDTKWHAHVDSIMAGSGARFSLLPPENATGNYVKVVQRVPVKIVFDESPDRQRVLGPGMSVEPDVQVGHGFGTAVKVIVGAALLIAGAIFAAAWWLRRIRHAGA